MVNQLQNCYKSDGIFSFENQWQNIRHFIVYLWALVMAVIPLEHIQSE